jgi:prepilin-type N-terminal cleavage/methylation domain-containing protein
MRSRGFTLIEMLVVIGLVGAAIAVFISTRGDWLHERASADAMASDLLTYADRLSAIATGPDMRSVPVATAVAERPNGWAVGRHPLGGAFLVEKGAAFSLDEMTVELTAEGVTPRACMRLVEQTGRRFYQVRIGTTTVKSTTAATLNLATVRTRCNAAASTPIVWTLLK